MASPFDETAPYPRVFDAVRAFRTEYTDPANVLPYESAEGGYQGQWFHTDDLVWQIGEEIGCDGFVEDLVAAYGDTAWCDADYFGSPPDELLSLSWERFAELVKYESRYLFLEHRHDQYDERVGPAEMLERIAAYIVEAGLSTAFIAQPQKVLEWICNPPAREEVD